MTAAHAPTETSPPNLDQRRTDPTVDIVMPVLNEAHTLGTYLPQLQQQPMLREVIVVDGGSADDTRHLVSTLIERTSTSSAPALRLIEAEPGRAMQMNAGAMQARAEVLLFLHADTRLSPHAIEHLCRAIADGSMWGRFDVRLDSKHMLFRIIERLINLRSALTGIATGDQGIFVRRDVFHMLGGYAPIELMEDVEFCARLKWVGRPARIREAICVSVRRWQRQGIVRTVVLMWTLRLLYWFGVSPARLARLYSTVR
ncbi:MAG: TIGR04283 family arsenosugar biosynthesis glycosyltransferase [Acidiferrobacterales bacterium]